MTDNSMKNIYQKCTPYCTIKSATGVAISRVSVGIMGYGRGLPQVSWQLLSTVQSSLKGTFGILGQYHQHDLHHCNYPYHCSADWNGLRHLSNEYAKPGKTGADD